jgi:MoxR-like ATPase
MALLKVTHGPKKDLTIRLGDEPVKLGRDPSCKLHIRHESVSRQHAQLEPVDGGWAVVDLGSSNGTFVNDARVERKQLASGDEIRIGDIGLQFLDEEAAPAPDAPPPKAPQEQEAPRKAPEKPAPRKAKVPEGIDLRAVEAMKKATTAIRREVGKVIVGQEEVLDQILAAMLARGHCLMVGVPGLAKTLIVRTISKILDLDFKRVQFTPDLMPSDITGTDILEVNEQTGEKAFRFIKGPIFTNMLLADEINRTPPKTQAALLEAMQERSVTASGHTAALPDPFFVLATQNPLEQEGTYPLPEAQLDRFMFNILVDYPSEAEEELIVKRTTVRSLPEPEKVLRASDIVLFQKIVWRVPVSDAVIRYATNLVRASRPGQVESEEEGDEFIEHRVQCGAGPRACQYLILGAKARAVIEGRVEATIEDVKAVAVPVLRHRIFVNFNALSEGVSPTDVARHLLKTVPPPADKSPIERDYTQSAPVDAGPVTITEPPEEGEQLNLDAIRQMRTASARIRDEVQKVIIGQNEVLDQIMMAMLSRGHCLMVGVPGLAKTLMVRTIASVLDLNFRRIQFTPDLMPSDITGTDILEEDERTGEKAFRFIQGPIFTNMLLADEINRTPPKTQAALLEAMQEYSVTASGNTYDLEQPFFVLATQNPLEQEGTYPLPEAQLDRFMFNIWVDYPTDGEEECIVKETTRLQKQEPKKVLGGREIIALQDIVRRVPVSDHVIKYATRLVRCTRPETPQSPQFIKDWVYCGAGPRACQYLILGGKARAVLDGRANVSCADVRSASLPVLRHRIFTNFNADSEGVDTVDIVARLLDAVLEPGEKDYAPKAKRKKKTAPARRPEAAVSYSGPAQKPEEQRPEVAPEAAARLQPKRETAEEEVLEGEVVGEEEAVLEGQAIGAPKPPPPPPPSEGKTDRPKPPPPPPDEP